MGRKGYNSSPLPDRDEDFIFYQEGEEPVKALEFLELLSDESVFQMSTPDNSGIERYSAVYTGDEVSRSINPEEGEGYLLAIYDWSETEDMTLLPESEIYVVFSDSLPSEDQKELELGTGAVIEGSDEGTASSTLVELARESLE